MFVTTYKQADRSKLPTRHDFGEAVEEALNSVKNKEESYYWVCFLGTLVIISLYKGYKPNRWMTESYSIKIHFSDNHESHYSGYKYVTK